jgi:lysophospholipase L1-like esterase
MTLILLLIVSFRYGVPQKLLDRLGIVSIPVKYNYKTEHYVERVDYFSDNVGKNIKIVMLGDSITEGVNWNELLERHDISNQGIGEDTTEGFINRLEYVYQLNPKLCFIMGGVNDLGKNISIDNIIKNTKEIISKLYEHDIQVIIQSTLYVSKKWPFWEKRNNDIMELNRQMEKYCTEHGVKYIDINQVVSKNGMLEEIYTNDGVHLLKNGYEKWKEIIKPIIEIY